MAKENRAFGFMHLKDIAILEQCTEDVCYRFAKDLAVLEIGIFDGHTCRSIEDMIRCEGVTGHDHWTVDNCLEDRSVHNEPFPGCKCLWGDSIDMAPKVPGNLAFVLVDGCHCLYHVLADFALYAPKVRVGGLMLFHDTNPRTEKEYQPYQYHGDRERRESYVSVRMGLKALGLLPLVRSDWKLRTICTEFEPMCWWGGLAVYEKVEVHG